MEQVSGNSIGWREKLRLLFTGAGVQRVPTGREIIIGKTTLADLTSDSDIVIPSGGGSLFPPDTDPRAFQELRDWINEETKGSGTK